MSTDRLSARQWLGALGVLVAGSMSIADAKERLGTYCPLLEGEFSPEVFNRRSLAFVAQRQKFFPPFHEVCTLLTEWGDAQPTAQALAIADASGADWKRRQDDERHAAAADWADPAKVRRSRDLVLSSPIRQLEFGRMLAALVGKHAPINLGLLPPEWLDQDEGRAAA
jgi:hypothetical protein